MEQKEWIDSLKKSKGISKAWIAQKLGLSRQNFHNKIVADRLTHKQIEIILKMIEL